jgi:hypothetical protein
MNIARQGTQGMQLTQAALHRQRERLRPPGLVPLQAGARVPITLDNRDLAQDREPCVHRHRGQAWTPLVVFRRGPPVVNHG